MLDAYGYFMQESAIETYPLVKDPLLRNGGVMKYNITADLILEVKGSYGKYIADLEQKKAVEMEAVIKRDKEKTKNDVKQLKKLNVYKKP